MLTSSKYWQFKLTETNAKKNWQDIIKNKPVIVSPKHTRDAQPKFLKENPKATSLHKKDKEKPFWVVFYINKEPTAKQEVQAFAKSIGGTYVKAIPDTDKYDWDLKQALRNSQKTNFGETKYALNKFQCFGNLVWKNFENAQGYYYYLKPYCYSKAQLVKYRYWTNKCLKYLPKVADDERKNSYGSGYYDVYSEDTVIRIERIPKVAKIIERKQKRLNDPEQVKKAQATAKKRWKTLKEKKKKKIEEEKQKLITKATPVQAKLNQKIEHIKQVDGKNAELGIALTYLEIVNHLAKTFQEMEHGYPIEDDMVHALLLQKYKTSSDLYYLKDRLFKIIAQRKLFGWGTSNKLIKLEAVIPPDSDLVSFDLCNYHRNDFREMSWKYDNIKEYYFDNKAYIDSCPDCDAQVVVFDYYSFYYLTVALPSGTTTWHIPYPIGSKYLPALRSLPIVKQTPNDPSSPFTFGREADENELLIGATVNLKKKINYFISLCEQQKVK